MAKKSKIIRQKENSSNSKQTKCIETPESFYDKHPVWSFQKLDDDYYKWGIIHENNINDTIINKFLSAFIQIPPQFFFR